MKRTFSNLDRKALIREISQEHYDLVVIGGGITGAGILLDAASRGIKTLLLEKSDFASGTSSKSTKLIHGGLRYLKQLDLALVREVGTERAIVHSMAPHLVIPEKMLLPLVANGTYNKWLTSMGLMVYDFLASVAPDDQRRMLTREETLQKEPLLPRERIKGAGYYAEYRTDDARLTLENIKTALDHGGTAINYLAVTEFQYKEDTIGGLLAKDQVTGEELQIACSYVINATGPWVDDLRTLNKSMNGKELHLSKGVHLVFPGEKFPVRQSVYFDAPDGRMIFAIPRDRVTYVGTTDTTYQDNKDRVTTNIDDASYLINAVNSMFPDITLKMEDIVSSWAGLRPLIHEKGKSPSELSRKDEIFVSDSGLISIAGGKLTGYRKMAERAVDKVAERLKKHQDRTTSPCSTHTITLCGGPWLKGNEEVNSYIAQLTEILRCDGLDTDDARYLVHTYGKQADKIIGRYQKLIDGHPEERLLRAEFAFCTENEMILDPLDFFIRRTGRLYFRIESVASHTEVILSDYADTFNASQQEVALLRDRIREVVREHSNFANSIR